MSPQLTPQQLAAQIAAYETRLHSKRLEVASLAKLRGLIPAVVAAATAGVPGELAVEVCAAGEDYLKAKIDWLSIDVQEYELTIKALRHQQSGILLARPAGRG